MLSDKPVVFSAKRISKDFGAGKTLKTAVKDVSFDIYDEEFISTPHMEQYLSVLLEDDVPQAYGISGSGKLEAIH